MSAMLNSFQSVVILMVISRIDDVIDAGTFVIAYAIANLLIMIGKYGVRQYQVSDVQEHFSFQDYLVSRVITTGLMMAAAVAYIVLQLTGGAYDMEKSVAVLAICGVKAVDAFEDVCHGMFQQHKRLDIAGKILSIRLFLYIAEYMIVYIWTGDLILTSVVALVTTVLASFLMNGLVFYKNAVPYEKKTADRRHLADLFKDCFPIFLSTFLMAYVANAPKYSIDVVLSSQEQAKFNYIFMPVFVISLLSTFIYQPMINRLAVIWHEKHLTDFWKLIFRQVYIILILTVAAMAAGGFLGIPVLSLLYGVDLAAYRKELIILLLGGGMLALVNFFTMVITITRYQKLLVWGYLVVSLAFLVAGKRIAGSMGIMGISIFYTVCVVVLALIFLFCIMLIAKNSKKEQ